MVKKRESLTKEILFGGPIREDDSSRQLKKILITSVVFGILAIIYFFFGDKIISLIILIIISIILTVMIFQYKYIKKNKIDKATRLVARMSVIMGSLAIIVTLANIIINGWRAVPYSIFIFVIGALFIATGNKVLKKK